jgi:hypothetical protein
MREALQTFLRNLLGSAAVLIAGFATVYFLGFHLPPAANCIGIIVSLSILFSFLLTADNAARVRSTPPATFWAGVVDLVANRQALLLFLLIAISIAAAGTYYIFTSLVTVQYTGESGVIFSLPGQTVYYMPIDPYESWMNTGIELKKDERFSVELSGRVSPGYLQGIETLQAQYNALGRRNDSDAHNTERPAVAPVSTATPLPKWPFTGPEGYDRAWYDGDTMLEVFKHEPVSLFYGKEHAPGYKNDNGLAVKGYPHNTVIGMILRDDEPPPRVADWNHAFGTGTPGYDSQADKEVLLILSSKRYPIECHAQRAGRLWVVINDTEHYRWDNAGFFFMKLTRYSSMR